MAECRICFSSENDSSDELISPCACNGTSKYIHRSCLNACRRMNINNYYRCDMCLVHYVTDTSLLQNLLADVRFPDFLTFLTLFLIVSALCVIARQKNVEPFVLVVQFFMTIPICMSLMLQQPINHDEITIGLIDPTLGSAVGCVRFYKHVRTVFQGVCVKLACGLSSTVQSRA